MDWSRIWEFDERQGDPGMRGGCNGETNCANGAGAGDTSSSDVHLRKRWMQPRQDGGVACVRLRWITDVTLRQDRQTRQDTTSHDDQSKTQTRTWGYKRTTPQVG